MCRSTQVQFGLPRHCSYLAAERPTFNGPFTHADETRKYRLVSLVSFVDDGQTNNRLPAPAVGLGADQPTGALRSPVRAYPRAFPQELTRRDWKRSG